MSTKEELENELIDTMAGFQFDPQACAEYSFPWGEPGSTLEHEKIRTWQRKLNEDIAKHLKDPKTRYTPFQGSIVSGHGIGKSAEVGMITHWAMSTCEDAKVIITSNTDTQLRTKTSPEIAKWFRMAINSHWFKPNATSIHSVDPNHIKTWRADLIPWSDNNTEAFAGAHNKEKIILIIFDEASSISDKIWEVTEGALTDENTIIIWLVFGNPTRNTGRFRECFRRFKHRWKNYQIDSRQVEGTNKKQLEQWVEDHGEDSDFVKVRVRGVFPSASVKQFIGTDDVDRAFGRKLREEQYNFAPKIIGVDPAWEGNDETAIVLRQGLALRVLATIPKNDNDVEMANLVARFEDQERADAVFIDAGYGTGIYSVGKSLGRNWQLVWFAGKPMDKGYLNKRAEIWGLMRTWLKEGGAIPKDQVLYDDLIGPETVARVDGRQQLESKDDMKERGLPSPNRADAVAITFAYPVARKNLFQKAREGKVEVESNPYEMRDHDVNPFEYKD